MHFVYVQINYGNIDVGNKLEMVINLNKGIISTLCHNHFKYCVYTCM